MTGNIKGYTEIKGYIIVKKEIKHTPEPRPALKDTYSLGVDPCG